MTKKLLKRVIDNAKIPGTLDFAPLTSDPLFGFFKVPLDFAPLTSS